MMKRFLKYSKIPVDLLGEYKLTWQDKELTINNYERLKDISPEVIATKCFSVYGSNLKISYLDISHIKIKGDISKVERTEENE